MVPLLNGRRLVVIGLHELVLQRRDVLYALVFERRQPRVERLLLRQQRLHRRQVPAVLLALDVRLLVGDPALHDVRLPHELQVGGVVDEPGLAATSQSGQVVQLGLQLLAALVDAVGVVVAVGDEFLARLADIFATVSVGLEVRFEGVMFLQET